MVNNDRIVPIQKIDFLSMIGTVLALAGEDVDVLPASTVNGQFSVSANGDYLANQPVKLLDFASGASAATVLFVAAFDYQGFTVAGAAAETDPINPDGITLYKATLASGAVTVEAVTPVLE